MLIVRVVAFLFGLAIILSTLFSATKQTVIPGRKRIVVTRFLFQRTFHVFRIIAARMPDEEMREATMAFYAPISVMLLPLAWFILLCFGFGFLFWSVGTPSMGTSLALSGAALTTEGVFDPKGAAQTIIYIFAGIIGLGIVGLLITFLPTIYSIYSQREQEVTRIAYRFGSPPSGAAILENIYRLALVHELNQFWHTWETWFTDMAETHISNIQVIFYHSSLPHTSWITTAGAILDACALYLSTVDQDEDPWLKLCLQAGCRTLLEIVSYASSLPPSTFASSGSIYVTRAEFDIACQSLEDAGVPLKPEREACWQKFVSLRSQYELSLFVLATQVFAPKAPWFTEKRVKLKELVK